MTKHKNIILLTLAIILAFSFLIFQRISCLKPNEELGVDVFYHVQMADGGPLFCLQRTFPHTDMSIWKTHFYDKELIFHLVLSVIRHWQQFIGLDMAPPFHFPALLFILINLLLLSFISYKINPKFAFMCPFIVVFLTPGFYNRLLMLRPHQMAIGLLILAAYFFPKIDTKKKLWIPVLFAVLFVYTYSNPHFILVPAILWAAFLMFEKKYVLAFQTVSVTILGLALALFIHPQSPNTFLLWKIQCIDVPLEIVFGKIEIGLGPELNSPSKDWLIFNLGIFALSVFNLIFFFVFVKHFSWRKTSIHTRFFICLQTLFTIGLFFSIRPIEYAVPFAALTSASLFHDLSEQREHTPRKLKIIAAVCIFLICFSPLAFYPWTAALKLTPSKTFTGFGQWAKKNLPKGTLIANMGWGDFTRLFYSAPHCRYLFALDPMFAYSYKPEETLKLRKFHQGTYLIYPTEMKKITNADFAFISFDDNNARKRANAMIKKLGYRPIYIGKDGCLFDLRSTLPIQ